jgi:hypothetical protein
MRHKNGLALNLAGFVEELLNTGDWCGDIDGDQIQDLALKHGILREVEVDATDIPCGAVCVCAEMFDPRVDLWATCYRRSEAFEYCLESPARKGSRLSVDLKREQDLFAPIDVQNEAVDLSDGSREPEYWKMAFLALNAAVVRRDPW